MADSSIIYIILIAFCCSHADSLIDECLTSTCTYNGHVFCGHIPCPRQPCNQPLVLTPGDCCDHCPTVQQADDPLLKDCPYPCTQGGVHYCHPIPCPLPPCVDAVQKKGICCPSCPNGPNCPAPDDHVVAYHHWEIIDGKNCTCELPLTNTTCV
ncbi:kielin/chordin-like protein [Mercenaria mercenaria]|uniref:kielin/chordin-like protein n=1 Tax=Mercenaria mercenaria TaxID=6596 RepID=UPI00234F2533|nr:kielin/chordin-like protein [Mercenaria mercenaria]